jgi:hypothetical protein
LVSFYEGWTFSFTSLLPQCCGQHTAVAADSTSASDGTPICGDSTTLFFTKRNSSSFTIDKERKKERVQMYEM